MDLAFPLDLGSDQKQGPRLSGMLVLVLSREGHVSLPGGRLNASTMIPARVTDPAGGGDFQWPWQPNRVSKAVTEQHTGPAFPHLSGQWIALGLRSSLGRALGRAELQDDTLLQMRLAAGFSGMFCIREGPLLTATTLMVPWF